MLGELKDILLFKDVDLMALEDLVCKGQIYKASYRRGITVHEQSTECCGMDMVLSGKLVAYALAANGSETMVFEFKKNSIIGGNLLFGEQNKYPMNIYCTADCVLLHISKSGVSKLLREHSFVIGFIKSLSLNSQGMNRKITMYTQKTLRENLMDYLLIQSATQKSNTIVLPITKKHLADYLGVQRPSLFRELKKMKEEGLIEIQNRIITLKH